MTGQKQTSTERVKAHQARQKELKQALGDKGFTTINLIVKKDQVFKINNAAKMLKKNPQQLLYSITQPAIVELCQKHDDILIRNARAEMEMLSTFTTSDSDFVDASTLIEIIGE